MQKIASYSSALEFSWRLPGFIWHLQSVPEAGAVCWLSLHRPSPACMAWACCEASGHVGKIMQVCLGADWINKRWQMFTTSALSVLLAGRESHSTTPFADLLLPPFSAASAAAAKPQMGLEGSNVDGCSPQRIHSLTSMQSTSWSAERQFGSAHIMMVKPWGLRFFLLESQPQK